MHQLDDFALHTIVNIIISSSFPFQFTFRIENSTSTAAAHDDGSIRCCIVSKVLMDKMWNWVYAVHTGFKHAFLHQFYVLFVIEHLKLMELKASHFQDEKNTNDSICCLFNHHEISSLRLSFFSLYVWWLFFIVLVRFSSFFPFLVCHGGTELRAQSLTISFFPFSPSSFFLFSFFYMCRCCMCLCCWDFISSNFIHIWKILHDFPHEMTQQRQERTKTIEGKFVDASTWKVITFLIFYWFSVRQTTWKAEKPLKHHRW